MTTRIKSIIKIMKAKDSELLKFIAIQKYYEIVKSTGSEEIASNVLDSSMDLDSIIKINRVKLK